MANQALQSRDDTLAHFDEAFHQLSRYLEKENISHRLLEQKINNACRFKNELLEKHHIYVRAAKLDSDSSDVLSWIRNHCDRAEDILDEASIKLNDIVSTKDDAVTKLRLQESEDKKVLVDEARYNILFSQFEADKKSFNILLEGTIKLTHDLNKGNLVFCKVNISELNNNYDQLLILWNNLVELSCSMNIDTSALLTSFNNFKSNFASNKCLINAAIETYTSDVNPLPSPTSLHTGSMSSKTIHLEKMKVPTFAGDVRCYANFKADFTSIVVPSYADPFYHAYVLKNNCLQGKPKSIIQNLYKIEDIWSRLDEAYGNIMDVVNLVIKDIEKVEISSNNNDQGMIMLVNTLEKGLQTLDAIGATGEITNAYSVKLIESKLPRRIYERWIKQQDKISSVIDGYSRFHNLFQFLKIERRTIEKYLRIHSKEDDKLKKKTTEVSNSAKIEMSSNSAKTDGASFQKNNSCLVHPQSDHLTRKCKKFLGMSIIERINIVKSTEGCALCLCLSHKGQECPRKSSWGPCGVNSCSLFHSRLLHSVESGVTQLSAHSEIFDNNIDSVKETLNSTNVLLLVERIKSRQGDLNILWDTGSTVSFVSKNFVKRYKLKGVEISYDLITVGGHIEKQNTYLHTVEIFDRDGNSYFIKACEIDSICGRLEKTNISSSIVDSFQGVSYSDVIRPYGTVDLLLGVNYAELHPVQVQEVDKLVLYETKFGTGKILGGSYSDSANFLNKITEISARVHSSNVRVKKTKLADPGLEFFSIEDLGIKHFPKCKSCTNCKTCNYESQHLSLLEHRELDPLINKWIVEYPYKCDAHILKNNYFQVLSILHKMEKRLLKNETNALDYESQFQDFIDRKVFVKISENEIAQYDGPVNYISHHEVFKESVTTPLRIVVNSSLKFEGVSLNQILMKGPNSLNDLLGILLRFRTYPIALVTDVSKMYHSILTTNQEKHLRRVLWRHLDLSAQPTTYGIATVTFGDRPAAAISAVAVTETAEIFSYIDPVAAEKIISDTYVDDITTGANNLDEITKLEDSITKIMSKGGFKLKDFIKSGDCNSNSSSISLIGTGDISRVLGVSWNPSADVFFVTVRINLSKTVNGKKVEPDMSICDIPKLVNLKLTRRILLGITNACYDPFGFLAPLTIKLKIVLRDLYRKELNLGWDTPIPETIVKKRVNCLIELKSAEKLYFKRCIKPNNAVGEPELILFNDGSMDAMCCAAYIRWKTSDETYVSYLYCAKTRVTPLRKITTPRAEIQSAVIAVRLSATILKHSSLKFKKVIHILDAYCVLSLLYKDSIVLKEFMGNRVAEILSCTDVSQWFHTSSSENIADLGTRSNATVLDIDADSFWQCGPKWLEYDFEFWPLSHGYNEEAVPVDELRSTVLHAHTNVPIHYNVFNLENLKHLSYLKMLRVVGIILCISKRKTFKISLLSSEDLRNAEEYIIQQSMKLTFEDYQKGKLKSLSPIITANGVIQLSNRAIQGFEYYYGNKSFPILTYRDPVSYIWLKFIHDIDHSGISRMVAKSREKFWIIKGRRLAQKIKSSCYKCRLIDVKLEKQIMSDLPICRLLPKPVFYSVSMDLFGHFTIKDTVKKRVEMKVWGVIITCLATRALYLDVSESYSTDSVLQVLRKFVSLRGCPMEILSDQGSQLVSASAEIAKYIENWDWSPIHEWASNRKIHWKFVPAGAHHMNGTSESLIKSVKRSIKHVIGNNKLSYSEFQLLLFEICCIINSRPIGVCKGNDPLDPNPLTPNHLILGRSTADVPQGPFHESVSHTKRFHFIQKLIDSWWNSWYEKVLPSLVPTYKWFYKYREVQAGDICLIKYSGDLRAVYRLGEVISTDKSADGVIRKILIKYKLPNESVFRNVYRSIHSIAVIVPIEERGVYS